MPIETVEKRGETLEIEFVDLKRQFADLKEDITEAIGNVLQDMQLNLGPNVNAFEAEFASYLGARYAVGVGSGTDALVLALRALEIGPGDEVITVAHSFFATAEAIMLCGARPVFVDIDPATYNMDTSQLEDAVSERTKAIMPVHLYGQPADMDEVLAIAGKHNLYVIEDACQAHGATYQGKAAGTFGDIAAFSFYCSKNLGAYGEAGMVVTNDEEIALRVQMLRNHGGTVRYMHESVGLNSRLDEMQAAILRLKLHHLPAWNASRRSIAHRYSKGLAGLSGIEVPYEDPRSEHVFHLYVIRAERRDELQGYLRAQGIASGIHYPVPIHLQRACDCLGYPEGSLPQTETAAKQILSLPIFPEMYDEEVDSVLEAIKAFASSRLAVAESVEAWRAET